jgi:protein O-GlcNAc transferase
MGELTFEQVFEAAIRQHRAGQLIEAIAGYRRAAEMRPGSASVQNNLSLACKEAGQAEEAVAAARRAVELAPHYPGFWTNQGNLARDLGNLDDAIAAYRRALALEPKSVAALNNLGITLHDAGQGEEAIALYRRAVELGHDTAIAHSNLLYALHFDPRYDAASILKEHRIWARRHADPLTAQAAPPANDSNPDRPLRIGYVSAYLQEHVVGRFMLPLLQGHDRAKYQAYCYADESGLRDVLTGKLMAASHTWRAIRGMSDEQVAALVREDRIDILVDLGMHASGSRLLVFARKPAPVQVTYLAYCGTTGLGAIDYRLTDPYLDPPSASSSQVHSPSSGQAHSPSSGQAPGPSDEDYSERSIRLPATYWCYQPPDGAGDPGPVPAQAAGIITFASLNSFAKVTPATLQVWARIFRAFPRSRLLLHAREGAHRQRVRDLFAAEGIADARLNFIGFVSIHQYFDLYRLTDIALDPFPYAGGTTTCDAIWAGVPVVTLAGRTAVGRGGVSILSNVGAGELIASTTEEYVQIATALANDLPRLTTFRETLRSRMQNSPLMDRPRFARDVEDAYRRMWREWCAGRGDASRVAG